MLTLKGRIDGGHAGVPPGHRGHASRLCGALRAAPGAMRRWIDVTTPGVDGPPAGGIRVHSGTTLTGGRRLRHRQHPVHVARPHAARRRRGRDAPGGRAGAGCRRAGADPRHARDRRRPGTRRRSARSEAAARRPGRAHRRQHADAQRSRGGVPRDLPRRRAAARRGERLDRLSRRRGAEADFLWREHDLIVEVDGRDPHTIRRRSTQTAGAMRASCCSAGASCASRGSRSRSSRPTSRRRSAGCWTRPAPQRAS